MSDFDRAIEKHYGKSGLLRTILDALQAEGKNLDNLAPEDLAPVDAFHARGRESTLELTELAQFQPGERVLDVGCGLGGSVRHIASEHDCVVTGLDLTAEFIEVATQLAQMVGLTSNVFFQQGSALELPFAAGSFDVVWTEHAQMNVPDKAQFYGEIARVLVPGGRLVFHDIFQGPGGDPHYPTPWAEVSSMSALVTPDECAHTIEQSGLEIRNWIDKTEQSLGWFRVAAKQVSGDGPASFGLHLLMGATAPSKFKNLLRNLEEGRVAIVQGTAS